MDAAVGKLLYLGPARVELQVVLLGETDGAVALVTQGADPLVSAAAPGFGDGDLAAAGLAFGDGPRCLVGHVAGSLNVGGHVGTVVLHRLETPHGTAELGALLDIFDGHIDHRVGAAHHLHAVGRGRPG